MNWKQNASPFPAKSFEQKVERLREASEVEQGSWEGNPQIYVRGDESKQVLDSKSQFQVLAIRIFTSKVPPEVIAKNFPLNRK